MQKHVLALLMTALVVMASGTCRAENYYNPVKAAETRQEVLQKQERQEGPEITGGTQFVTVTSVQKCYDQLDPEESLDIQRNFIKPYQECKRRLALKLQKRKSTAKLEEKADQKAEEQAEDVPQNYHQVQKSPRPSVEKKAEEKQKKLNAFQADRMKLN